MYKKHLIMRHGLRPFEPGLSIVHTGIVPEIVIYGVLADLPTSSITDSDPSVNRQHNCRLTAADRNLCSSVHHFSVRHPARDAATNVYLYYWLARVSPGR